MTQPSEARYQQIVRELRELIDSGALRPGDRVPSTREITRRWGVAMATATKVLTELRHAGLVHAVRGVGTVVTASSAPAARPRVPTGQTPRTTNSRAPADNSLTRERIVAAAIAVADAEGLAAVSMRRVATEVGAATMSLYRHVADKDDLLTQMLDAVFAAWSFPAQPPPTWRERLELAGRMLWSMFRQHPWLAPAMSVTRPQPAANAVPFTEWVLATLDGHGLDLPTMFTAHLTLFNYVRGVGVNLELEAEAEAASGLDPEEWMDTQLTTLNAIVDSGPFPMLANVISTGYDFDLDTIFEFGLQRLLDGLSVLLDSAGGKST